MRMIWKFAAGKRVLVMSVALMCVCGCTTTDWRGKLESELPVYGHRNWIVVADMAYPKQSAAGIETLYTDGGQIETLKTVLAAIECAPHVNPIVLVDEELEHVTEQDAPGIERYRNQLSALLEGREVETKPHEGIIEALDADAETFNILLLKTHMTIPYTSVFLKLDCGYWNAEKEARLREAIGKK